MPTEVYRLRIYRTRDDSLHAESGPLANEEIDAMAWPYKGDPAYRIVIQVARLEWLNV